MWVHPINIKRPEFGIFSHLTWICSMMKRILMAISRMNIEQFYCLSQLVEEKIRKQNTSNRRAISPEERLVIFLDACYKNL